MAELSLDAMINIRNDAERQRTNKAKELSKIPKGVRSSHWSTDEAFLLHDIQELNKQIEEYNEIIAGRIEQNETE
jgi:hypothetical protein